MQYYRFYNSIVLAGTKIANGEISVTIDGVTKDSVQVMIDAAAKKGAFLTAWQSVLAVESQMKYGSADAKGKSTLDVLDFNNSMQHIVKIAQCL